MLQFFRRFSMLFRDKNRRKNSFKHTLNISSKNDQILVHFGTILGQKGIKKGDKIEACCPKGSLEAPGDVPGTLFGASRGLPGEPGGSPGSLLGVSWGLKSCSGQLLEALKRHFQGVGGVSGTPSRFFTLFSRAIGIYMRI